MYSVDELIKLKEAGFDAADIISLCSANGTSQEANTESVFREKETIDVPAENSVSNNEAPKTAPEPIVESQKETVDDLKSSFKAAVDDALKELRASNIAKSQQPATETVDDILAGFINKR